MAEDIKLLIEKIQQEGIKVAEDKARAIEDQAKDEAGRIIGQAKDEARRIVEEAQEKINKMQAASESSLAQSGRNLLISLKKEINALLDKVIALSVRQVLSPAELSKILSSLITEAVKQGKDNIVVSLSKEDLEKMGKGFLSELKDEIKKGISLKASEEVLAGFLISFDAGKSHFDFTEKAIVDYLGNYLRPELTTLLTQAP